MLCYLIIFKEIYIYFPSANPCLSAAGNAAGFLARIEAKIHKTVLSNEEYRPTNFTSHALLVCQQHICCLLHCIQCPEVSIVSKTNYKLHESIIFY